MGQVGHDSFFSMGLLDVHWYHDSGGKSTYVMLHVILDLLADRSGMGKLLVRSNHDSWPVIGGYYIYNIYKHSLTHNWVWKILLDLFIEAKDQDQNCVLVDGPSMTAKEVLFSKP